MTSIKKVDSLCKKVLLLTNEEISECKEMAREQFNYSHPFKHATARKFNELGEHNLKVISEIKNLREILKEYDKTK